MDALDALLRQIRGESKEPVFKTHKEWADAVTEYKNQTGTTKGFPGGRTYTDASGQEWTYNSLGKDKDGNYRGTPRRAEATKRFQDQRKADIAAGRFTKQEYIDEFGTRAGTSLYNQHRAKLKVIRASIGTPGFDVDHIDSAHDGGGDLPKNFRLQNRVANRSQQNRGLTPPQRNALLLPKGHRNQLVIQGPLPTPNQRQQILSNPLGLLNEMTRGIGGIENMTNRQILQNAADFGRFPIQLAN